MFCCLWRNVEASCHKHFVVVSRYQHRRLLPVISVTTCGTVVRRHCIDNTWPVAALTAGSEARYRLRITISAYLTCIWRPRYWGSHWNIAMPFGMEKLEWCGYPLVKKFQRYVNSFWQNVRTWRTQTHRHSHRRTLHDSIGRTCKASRGKNEYAFKKWK